MHNGAFAGYESYTVGPTQPAVELFHRSIPRHLPKVSTLGFCLIPPATQHRLDFEEKLPFYSTPSTEVSTLGFCLIPPPTQHRLDFEERRKKLLNKGNFLPRSWKSSPTGFGVVELAEQWGA